MPAPHPLSPTLAALLLGAFLATAPVALEAGSITGTVRAHGAQEAADAGGAAGSYANRRYKFLERVDYEQMADFVVYIDQPAPAGSPAPASPPVAIVRQHDGSFVPHVLPIAVGTTVEWPNDDEIFHNAFSMSETTPFDLGLYKNGDTARRVTFDKTGRADVFCSIHTKMSCIILVLPNAWFARSDEKGRYVIKNVPPGTYKLRAWHERLPAQTREVVVTAEGEVPVDFTLGPGGAPKN